ncbi:hypothetical protein VCR15J2_470503 [Vibrio coralliirubri]|nr:hypothetical protein VCR15J2_470503 [Vibrio coralliirubri]
MFSRKVIGCSINHINDTKLVLRSLNKAWEQRQPLGIEYRRQSVGTVNERLKSVCREKETVGIMLVLKASLRNIRKSG